MGANPRLVINTKDETPLIHDNRSRAVSGMRET
jgi:hypothetical protein